MVVALVLGVGALLQHNPQLLESRKERRARAMFAYSQRLLGDMLEGVSLRFSSTIDSIAVLDSQGRLVVSDSNPYRLSDGSVEELLTWGRNRSEEMPERARVERWSGVGFYEPSGRTIWINRNAEWDLQTIGHEIAHAAVRYPRSEMDFALAPNAAKLNEAIAGTLGEIDLVFAYLAEEGRVDPELMKWGRVKFYEDYWQRVLAPPDESWPVYQIEISERYRPGEHMAKLVCGIVEADAPLEERFRRARQVLRVVAGVE